MHIVRLMSGKRRKGENGKFPRRCNRSPTSNMICCLLSGLSSISSDMSLSAVTSMSPRPFAASGRTRPWRALAEPVQNISTLRSLRCTSFRMLSSTPKPPYASMMRAEGEGQSPSPGERDAERRVRKASLSESQVPMVDSRSLRSLHGGRRRRYERGGSRKCSQK